MIFIFSWIKKNTYSRNQRHFCKVMRINLAENTTIYAFGEIIKSAFRFHCGQKFEYRSGKIRLILEYLRPVKGINLKSGDIFESEWNSFDNQI